MTDQQAIDHITDRMSVAIVARAELATMRAIIDQTRAAFHEAGVLSGPLPERVRKLSADLRDVAADRDRLRAELDAIRAPAAPDVAPPMCPSSKADLEQWGDWWYFDNGVVRVSVADAAWSGRALLVYWEAGDEMEDGVFPSDLWSGPVPKPRRSVLPVAP
jgi:hypothetical protein